MPTASSPPYIRCRDLEGGLWTVPPGSVLWQELLEDQGGGGGMACVPIELLRTNESVTAYDQTAALEHMMFSALNPDDEDPAAVFELYAIGQFQRLVDRTRRRHAHAQ